MALDKNIAISIVVRQFASAVSYELFARGQMVPSVKTRLTKWDLTNSFSENKADKIGLDRYFLYNKADKMGLDWCFL